MTSVDQCPLVRGWCPTRSCQRESGMSDGQRVESALRASAGPAHAPHSRHRLPVHCLIGIFALLLSLDISKPIYIAFASSIAHRHRGSMAQASGHDASPDVLALVEAARCGAQPI